MLHNRSIIPMGWFGTIYHTTDFERNVDLFVIFFNFEVTQTTSWMIKQSTRASLIDLSFV